MICILRLQLGKSPDRPVEVALVVVPVLAGQAVRFALGEVVDALVGFEVVLDPEPFTLGVDPHVGVRRVPVHVPPRLGNSSVTHQPGDLM
jgi:hypothetical protein